MMFIGAITASRSVIIKDPYMEDGHKVCIKLILIARILFMNMKNAEIIHVGEGWLSSNEPCSERGTLILLVRIL